MISRPARLAMEWSDDDDDNEQPARPTLLLELDAAMVSAAMPGPPRLPSLMRSQPPLALEGPRIELTGPGWSVPLSLASVSLRAPRLSRRPTIRAPLSSRDLRLVQPSIRPTVTPARLAAVNTMASPALNSAVTVRPGRNRGLSTPP